MLLLPKVFRWVIHIRRATAGRHLVVLRRRANDIWTSIVGCARSWGISSVRSAATLRCLWSCVARTVVTDIQVTEIGLQTGAALRSLRFIWLLFGRKGTKRIVPRYVLGRCRWRNNTFTFPFPFPFPFTFPFTCYNLSATYNKWT